MAIAWFALPENRGPLAEPGCDVPVERVVRGVRFAANEPLGVRLVPLQRLGERREPLQVVTGELRRGVGRVSRRGVPEFLVFVKRFDAGSRRELGRRWEKPRFMHYRINLPACLRCHRTTPLSTLPPPADARKIAILTQFT